MKHSIAKQIAAIFITVTVLLIGANIAANEFFLEPYYVSRFEKQLKNVYEQMNAAATEDGLDQQFFEWEFPRLSSYNNMDLVILDNDFKLCYRTLVGNSEIMAGRIWGYNMGTDTDNASILETTDQYTIQKKSDTAMEMDFLEMWGKFDNGFYFMLRIPLENISRNANISNEFMLYFSIPALLIGVLLIMVIANRIARPINELTVLSKKMAELDFDAKYQGKAANEVDVLGEHFNQMSEKLEQTISQLKTANNELQRDIERKNQIDDMRKEFLSNVSHELKTPLALIQGYSEGLKEFINDDEESREYYCDVIIDEASKMNQLVQKLLTLNQLEFGNTQPEVTRINLTRLVEGKVNATQILAQQKGAVLELELPDADEEYSAWGDEFQVEEVLTNYLSNALNHVSGGMKIFVRIENQQEHIRVLVHNTGAPIPEEDLDRIWEKFYKVDKARTREYGGSGVGLSIVRAIMDGIHQQYGVYNDADGVTFWFELETAGVHETAGVKGTAGKEFE